MTKQEFEQYIFENYTIDENPMAREIFQNLLTLIATFPSERHYELLCEYVPQIEERIIRQVEL